MEPLSPELVASQFTMQRKKERLVASLATRGVRAFVGGAGLCGLGAVGATVAPPEWYRTIVFPLVGLGGLLALFGALLLFGALVTARRS
jgi:hypothetical protein